MYSSSGWADIELLALRGDVLDRFPIEVAEAAYVELRIGQNHDVRELDLVVGDVRYGRVAVYDAFRRLLIAHSGFATRVEPPGVLRRIDMEIDRDAVLFVAAGHGDAVLTIEAAALELDVLAQVRTATTR